MCNRPQPPQPDLKKKTILIILFSKKHKFCFLPRIVCLFVCFVGLFCLLVIFLSFVFVPIPCIYFVLVYLRLLPCCLLPLPLKARHTRVCCLCVCVSLSAVQFCPPEPFSFVPVCPARPFTCPESPAHPLKHRPQAPSRGRGRRPVGGPCSSFSRPPCPFALATLSLPSIPPHPPPTHNTQAHHAHPFYPSPFSNYFVSR